MVNQIAASHGSEALREAARAPRARSVGSRTVATRRPRARHRRTRRRAIVDLPGPVDPLERDEEPAPRRCGGGHPAPDGPTTGVNP